MRNPPWLQECPGRTLSIVSILSALSRNPPSAPAAPEGYRGVSSREVGCTIKQSRGGGLGAWCSFRKGRAWESMRCELQGTVWHNADELPEDDGAAPQSGFPWPH
eukprot:scaffold11541_cov22-Tisochrysis_lutea.AAC.1